MAFPVVEGTNQSGQATGTTSHTILLPSGIVAGETLITYLCAQGITGLTFPAGWTQLAIGLTAGFNTVHVAYRKALGSDTNPAVTWTGSQAVSCNSYRISGATDPEVTAPEVAHANDILDCPSLSPAGGSKDYLWIVGLGVTGDRAENPPANYTNDVRFASPSMTMATSRRTLTAATENPGLWTKQGGSLFTASTLAVHPGPDPTAALSGSITNDSELDIRNGISSTIVLTLTDDTWVAAGGTFNAQRQPIIDGIVSAQSEDDGWDLVARPAIAVTDVVRTNATVVTITMPAVPGYNITAGETIEATIPAAALVSAGEIIATPTFAITFLTESAVLSGSVTDDTELDIRVGTSDIVLTLTNALWEADVGADNTQTQDLIDGLNSDLAEPGGWDAVVRAGLTFANVARTSNTVVTITLPPFPAYNIGADETMTATIPASALDFPDALTASPTFSVTDLPPPGASTIAVQEKLLLL